MLQRALLGHRARLARTPLREALALVWARTKLLIEPTSALPVAAIAAGAIPGRRIGVVLSGGNLDAPPWRTRSGEETA